jgi:hypothetical protein
VTRLKCKLVSVCLVIELILTQDRCIVSPKHTIDLEIGFPMEILGDVAHVESCLGPFRVVLASKQDRFKVCANRTIGLEIGLDAPYGTPSDEPQVDARFGPFGDSANLDIR